MPTAVIRPLAEVASRLPDACSGWRGSHSESGTDSGSAPDGAIVLHVVGDLRGPSLALTALLGADEPCAGWLADLLEPSALADHLQRPQPLLVFIEGSLHIDGLLSGPAAASATAVQYPLMQLVVAGGVTAHSAVLAGLLMCVQEDLSVTELLWCGPDGALDVGGNLNARVALFTGKHKARLHGAKHVEWLLDETQHLPNLAQFCPDAAAHVVMADYLLAPVAGPGGTEAMLDRERVVAALRRGLPVAHGSADIRAQYPVADGLCADGQLSAENLSAVLRSPVFGHREFVATGWFGQTDFALCRRHVDADGDQRDDSLYITVWKTWDFHLSVDLSPARQGIAARVAATLLRRRGPAPTPTLTLLYRPYEAGEPGEWAALDASAPQQAWSACQQAWRGVLDYVRKAVGQHHARYPLFAQLQAELSAANIKALASIPLFTDEYHDWWSSERSGLWLEDVWVGARQPCMHEGLPWGVAVKLSWRNGAEACGDAPDDAHSAYQLDLDEARQGPPVVTFSYTQRQSAERSALPRGAADHVARLLRMHRWVAARLFTRPMDAAGQKAAVDGVPCPHGPTPEP